MQRQQHRVSVCRRRACESDEDAAEWNKRPQSQRDARNDGSASPAQVRDRCLARHREIEDDRRRQRRDFEAEGAVFQIHLRIDGKQQKPGTDCDEQSAQRPWRRVPPKPRGAVPGQSNPKQTKVDQYGGSYAAYDPGDMNEFQNRIRGAGCVERIQNKQGGTETGLSFCHFSASILKRIRIRAQISHDSGYREPVQVSG